MSQIDEDLEEKKLLGSGGYAIAKLTEKEELKANLGVPQLFLANMGRLPEDRFLRYYCNKCAKEQNGAPSLIFEVPNEEIAENIILVEKGEYKCRNCDNTIAQYRKFSQ